MFSHVFYLPHNNCGVYLEIGNQQQIWYLWKVVSPLPLHQQK